MILTFEGISRDFLLWPSYRFRTHEPVTYG